MHPQDKSDRARVVNEKTARGQRLVKRLRVAAMLVGLALLLVAHSGRSSAAGFNSPPPPPVKGNQFSNASFSGSYAFGGQGTEVFTEPNGNSFKFDTSSVGVLDADGAGHFTFTTTVTKGLTFGVAPQFTCTSSGTGTYSVGPNGIVTESDTGTVLSGPCSGKSTETHTAVLDSGGANFTAITTSETDDPATGKNDSSVGVISGHRQ